MITSVAYMPLGPQNDHIMICWQKNNLLTEKDIKHFELQTIST